MVHLCGELDWACVQALAGERDQVLAADPRRAALVAGVNPIAFIDARRA